MNKAALLGMLCLLLPLGSAALPIEHTPVPGGVAIVELPSGTRPASVRYGDQRVMTTRKPDALLPSEHSAALFGVLAAGGRSGGRAAMNGTSVAAPHLARVMANAAQNGFTPDRAYIQAQAMNEDNPPPAASQFREGWGRLIPRYGLAIDRG